MQRDSSPAEYPLNFGSGDETRAQLEAGLSSASLDRLSGVVLERVCEELEHTVMDAHELGITMHGIVKYALKPSQRGRAIITALTEAVGVLAQDESMTEEALASWYEKIGDDAAGKPRKMKKEITKLRPTAVRHPTVSQRDLSRLYAERTNSNR